MPYKIRKTPLNLLRTVYYPLRWLSKLFAFGAVCLLILSDYVDEWFPPFTEDWVNLPKAPPERPGLKSVQDLR